MAGERGAFIPVDLWGNRS